jgi:hypothetical protein
MVEKEEVMGVLSRMKNTGLGTDIGKQGGDTSGGQTAPPALEPKRV